jgi:aspartyl-tRNA(Asn)/glutamyl-tRNA(Gln) amidotransferase subunit A
MYNTFAEVSKALASGSTVLDIVKHYLTVIDQQKELNAFIEVFQDSALEQASLVDQKRASGKAGRLAGMVIGLKDNICYKGHQVSASSNILTGFESLFSATAVQRLLDEDAIIIGRLNCDEFAMGSSNETSAYGPVKNNLDPTRVPGGSSGGCARQHWEVTQAVRFVNQLRLPVHLV